MYYKLLLKRTRFDDSLCLYLDNSAGYVACASGMSSAIHERWATLFGWDCNLINESGTDGLSVSDDHINQKLINKRIDDLTWRCHSPVHCPCTASFPLDALDQSLPVNAMSRPTCAQSGGATVQWFPETTH
jgi:hypothetical protein